MDKATLAIGIAILLLSASTIAILHNNSVEEYALKFKNRGFKDTPAVEQYQPSTQPSPQPTPQNQQTSELLQIVRSILESIGMVTMSTVGFITNYLSDYGISPQQIIQEFDGPGFIAREFAWDHDPLTVSINLANNNIDPSTVDLVKSAIGDWQGRIRASAGVSNVPYDSAPFGIRYVSSSADITITLTERADSALGLTKAYYRLGKIVQADAVIATKTAMGLQLDKADIQNIATHEFGHALGLGHSTVYGDVMYESYDFIATSRIIYPSACDVNKILSIYLKDGSGFRPPNTYSDSGKFKCNGA